MVITVGQPKQWGVHSIDQRGEKMTQARNCNAEKQVARIPHLLGPRVHPRTPERLQRGHCPRGGQSSNRKDRSHQATTKPPNQSRTRLYLIRLVSDDAVHVHVDVLVDDKDVHVDWAIVGRDVDPGGHGGHGFRRV